MNNRISIDMRQYKLSELVSIKKGKKVSTLSEGQSIGALPVLNIVNLRGEEPEFYSDDKKAVKCIEEDILIAWDGANAGIVATGLTGCIGSTIAKLKIRNQQIVDNEYLYYFLRWKEIYLRKTTIGAAIPHISRKRLENIQVPIPSLEEQKIISKVLSKIDATILNVSKRKEDFDSYLFSQYAELFIENSDRYNWNSKRVEKLVKNPKKNLRTGPFGSDLLHSEFVDEGISVIGIDNAVNNRFQWGERRFITEEKYSGLQRYTLYPGDVVITIMGTTGRSAVIPDDIGVAINSKHLAAITLDKDIVNPYFVSYTIHSNPEIANEIDKSTRGAIMKGLNLGIIKKLALEIPPIELQNLFAEIAIKVESISIRHDELINEYRLLLKSLMQYYFKYEKFTSLEKSTFTYEEFKSIITSNYLDEYLSFSELKRSISKLYSSVEYEMLKKYLFCALSSERFGENLSLNQIYHYNTNDDDLKNIKFILKQV